jgi:hypothetical protein
MSGLKCVSFKVLSTTLVRNIFLPVEFYQVTFEMLAEMQVGFRVKWPLCFLYLK